MVEVFRRRFGEGLDVGEDDFALFGLHAVLQFASSFARDHEFHGVLSNILISSAGSRIRCSDPDGNSARCDPEARDFGDGLRARP